MGIRPVGRPRRGHGPGCNRYSRSGKCKDCDREEGTRLAKERSLRLPPQRSIPRGKANQNFTFFPNLPAEIQNQIWEIGANEPRVVVTGISAKTGGAISLSPIPALLHTCQKSRKIGLTQYSLSFAGRFTGPKPYIEPRIYFNFEKDILYIPKSVDKFYIWKFANAISDEDRQKLRFAGVALSDDMTGHTTECLLSRIYSGIERVSLALESPRLDVNREVGLLPLGSRERGQFEKVARRIFGNRLVPRELSSEDALEACKRAAVDIYGDRDGGNCIHRKKNLYERAKAVSFATAGNW